MIQKKKVLSTLLSTAACLSLMCGTAFAAEGQTDLTGDTEATSTTTTITGTITPVQLKAAVPTNIAFAIDPNQTANYSETSGDAFTCPSFKFSNLCNAPLSFSVSSITAKDSAPTIVEESTFTDDEWKSLTSEQTKENLALGYVLENAADWHQEDNNAQFFQPGVSLTLGNLNGQTEGNAHLMAKYGMAWPSDMNQIVYDVVYKVAIS